MARPLRAVYANTTYSTGVQEMSDSDIDSVIAPVVLSYIVNNPTLTYGTTLRVNSAGTYDISRGSAIDTRNSTIGTHPASNSTISTYTVYQNERTVSPLGVTVRPVHYVGSGAEQRVVEMTDAEIYTWIAPSVVQTMIAGGQGGYYLGLTSAGAPATGTWVSYATLTDTYYNAGGLVSDSYTLWQRTTGTSAGTVRPLRLTGGLLIEMTDAEIQSMNAMIGEYIRTTGIGQYAFQTSAPGTGTWVNRGTFTNTINNLVDTAYAGTYAGSYAGNFTGAFTGSYTSLFTGSYTGAYTRVTTASFTASYTGVYSSLFTGLYTGLYTGSYTGIYAGAYAGTYVGSYVGSYASTFTGVYSRIFTGQYTGSYAGGYIGYYAGTYTGSYVGYYAGGYVGYYAGTYTGSYVGYYAGGYAGGYVGYYGGTYVGYYAGTYTAVSIDAYDGIYAGSFWAADVGTSTAMAFRRDGTLHAAGGDDIYYSYFTYDGADAYMQSGCADTYIGVQSFSGTIGSGLTSYRKWLTTAPNALTSTTFTSDNVQRATGLYVKFTCLYGPSTGRIQYVNDGSYNNYTGTASITQLGLSGVSPIFDLSASSNLTFAMGLVSNPYGSIFPFTASVAAQVRVTRTNLGSTAKYELRYDIYSDSGGSTRVGGGYIQLCAVCNPGGSVSVNAYMPLTTKLAGAMVTGDPLLLLSADGKGTRDGVVTRNRFSMQNLLTLVSSSGIRLTCSDNTPLTLEDGSCINSTEVLGQKLPVQDSNGFRWEEIVEVLDAGRGQVATISCDNQCYAAGDKDGQYIWTHNVQSGK